MTFEKPGLTAFVPYGDDRSETARMLVDLADKHGISQNDIHAANDGFYISEDLADLIGSDDEDTVGEQADDLDPALTDPIAADRARIREAEQGAVFSQASAIATEQKGVEEQDALDERNATAEAEAAEAAEYKAAIAAYNEDESEEAEESNTEVETESDEEEETEPVDYSEWEYPALKHEVAERGLDTTDQKAETLALALAEDDATKALAQKHEDEDEVE